MPEPLDGGLGAAGAAADSGMGANPVGVSAGVCPLGGGGAGPSPPAPATPPAPTPVRPKVAPVITASRNEVLVHKSYIPAALAVRTVIRLTDSEPGGFDGSGTLKVQASGGARVDLFDAPTGGNLVVSSGGSVGFTAAQLNAGVTLHAQGSAPSAAVNDVVLELTLSPGATRDVDPPQNVKVTSVELFLEICQSRTGAGVDPVEIPVPNKVTEGRPVHVQDIPGRHHGRALLIVKKALPNAWPGNMELFAFDARVRLFNDPDEVAAAGQTQVTLPLTIGNGSVLPRRFWAEGASVSGGPHDTGFQLGIPGLSRDGDWARMTVVQFQNLQATVPATAPHTVRGNAPAVHTFTVSAANQAVEAFTPKQPLVLVEHSILDAKLVNLSVQIAPAGVPVFWKVQRAQVTGSATPFDHADVIALSTNAVPTVVPIGSNTLTPTLKADSAGSFLIHAYVDCNGTADFERDTPAGVRIDREPFAVMNLVLVHVELDVDDSRTNSLVFQGTPDGANGISVGSGNFNTGAVLQNACRMNARIIMVGGGADGKTGLNRVFAGWVNNEFADEDVVGTFRDPGPPVATRRSRSVFVSNRGVAGTVAHPTAGVAFPPGGPAPALRAAPLLDVGPARAPEGTGGERACLTLSAMGAPANRTPAPGQLVRITCIDSPGDGEPANHVGFAAAQLTDFRFRLFFRVALCVWTGTLSSSAVAANRLYTVVRQYEWLMRGQWTINPGTGAVAAVGTPSVSFANQITKNPVEPVEGHDMEVRFPTGMSSLARDCRT